MANEKDFQKWYGTTIVSVRKKNEVVVAGDGQVTLGDTVIKANAKKVRILAKIAFFLFDMNLPELKNLVEIYSKCLQCKLLRKTICFYFF